MKSNQKIYVYLFIIGISFLGLWMLGNSNQNVSPVVNDNGETLPYGIRMIGADKVWQLTLGSPEVVVAILDSGFDTSHTDLQNILWINEDEIPDNGVDDDGNGYIDDVNGWDFVHQNNDPFSLLVTSNSVLKNHGTHVTGVVVAQLNDYGVVGVAPGVSIMPLRVINEDNRNPDILVAEAIEYATANGADIISMSLSISAEWGEITNSTSYQLVESAIAQAYDANLLLVAAAGNDGGSTPVKPADDPHVISVGAIDSAMNLAVFSNHGAEVVAPGVDINSTKPFERFGLSSGTSQATPHVTGALALLKSYNKSISNIELRTLLQNSTVDLGYSGYDADFGYGLINVTNAMELLSGESLAPQTSTTEELSITDFSTSYTATHSSDIETTTIQSTSSEITTTSSATNYLPIFSILIILVFRVKFSKR